MNAPLSRYLTRFAAEDIPTALPFEPDFIEPDIEVVFDDSVNETEAIVLEARRVADLEHDAAMNALREAHVIAVREAVDTSRAEWVATEAAAITPLIDTAFTQLSDILSKRIANVLRPLLSEAATARTLKVLGQTIDRILIDPKHPVLHVRGPADLLEAIRAQRPANEGLTFEDHDGIEILVKANGMRIETRLGLALAKIARKER